MKIKSVALLGAGAVGAYIIWGLSEVKNIEFGIVAEGSRKERLERDGIGINGRFIIQKYGHLMRQKALICLLWL